MKTLRTRLSSHVTFALCILVSGCQSTPSSGPTLAGMWTSEIEYAADERSAGSVYVEWKDPSGAADLELLAAAFFEVAESKNYTRADHPSRADFICHLGVRYFGRTAAPETTAAIVERAGPSITGGRPEWIGTDRIGPDGDVAPVTTIAVDLREKDFVDELFHGPQRIEWALVMDVAVGVRDAQLADIVLRHEGRLWVSIEGADMERDEAVATIEPRFEKLIERALP